MSTAKKVGIAVAVVVCTPILVAEMISAAWRSLDGKPTVAVRSTPVLYV